MEYCQAIDTEHAERLFGAGGLSHAEKADTLRFLREEGYSPTQLRKLTGLKDYTIRHYLRISKKLEPSVKDLLHKNRISFSMARAIASLPAEKQDNEARKAIMSGTSVQRLRGKLFGNDTFTDEKTQHHFERLASYISEQTGLSVTIVPDKDNKHAGVMHFRYTDMRDFDAMCERLKVNLDEF